MLILAVSMALAGDQQSLGFMRDTEGVHTTKRGRTFYLPNDVQAAAGFVDTIVWQLKPDRVVVDPTGVGLALVDMLTFDGLAIEIAPTGMSKAELLTYWAVS